MVSIIFLIPYNINDIMNITNGFQIFLANPLSINNPDINPISDPAVMERIPSVEKPSCIAAVIAPTSTPVIGPPMNAEINVPRCLHLDSGSNSRSIMKPIAKPKHSQANVDTLLDIVGHISSCSLLFNTYHVMNQNHCNYEVKAFKF